MNIYKLVVQLKTGNIIVGYVSAEENVDPNNISSALLIATVDFFTFHDMKGQQFTVSPSAVASMTISLYKRDVDNMYAQLFLSTIMYTIIGGPGTGGRGSITRDDWGGGGSATGDDWGGRGGQWKSRYGK